MDLAESGFSDIAAIARLALYRLEPLRQSSEALDDIAQALKAICNKAVETQADLDGEAERVRAACGLMLPAASVAGLPAAWRMSWRFCGFFVVVVFLGRFHRTLPFLEVALAFCPESYGLGGDLPDALFLDRRAVEVPFPMTEGAQSM